MFTKYKSKLLTPFLILLYVLLTACGGSSSDQINEPSRSTDSEQVFIVGGGIKGPLAFAHVNLYSLDTKQETLYDTNNPIASATTDAYAQIRNLAVPSGVTPPYVMVIDGTNSIDLNTGKEPVIKKLVTVITQKSLNSRKPIFATPYTTIAFHMLSLELANKAESAAETNRNIDTATTILSLEAENYSSSVKYSNSRWDTIKSISSSGGYAVKGSADSAKHLKTDGYSDISSRLDYTFSTSAPGTYYVWTRVISGSSNANSLHIGLDYTETATKEYVSYPISTDWMWHGGNGLSINVKEPGTHTLNIWIRESGILIDKLIITRDSSYIPSGKGPAESLNEYSSSSINIDTTMDTLSKLVISSLGFGLSDKIDIFSTPPVITENTTTIDEQQSVVSHRAAVEAISTLVHRMHLNAKNVSTDDILKELATDLHADGNINGMANDIAFNAIDFAVLSLNPGELNIANTKYLVKETAMLIDLERNLTGYASNTPYYKNDINVSLLPIIADSNTMAGISNTIIASALISSGPVVINGEQDVVISGLHITNPNGSCIEVKNSAANITIEDSVIGPCGKKGIDILNSNNITIRNNYIHNTVDEGIMSYQGHHVSIDSNHIENVQSGFEIWKTNIGHISFTNNFVKNVHRNHAAKNGGNVVQVAFVHAPGIIIRNNIGINTLGESDPEDLVNVYKSDGTASSPILISNNKFNGSGDSPFGGGIILSDQGGDYQIAENNVLVNPGQYGIQIGGGKHNVLRGNKIFSDDQRDFTNVGVFIWRYNDNGTGTQPGECSNNTIEFNEVTWWKGPNYKNNGLPASLNPSWNPSYGSDLLEPNCGLPAGWNTNKFDTQSSRPANLDTSIWNSQWDTASFPVK